MGLTAEHPGQAEVAGHGSEPADVVVAGDHDVGRNVAQPVEVIAGPRELPLRAALCEVAGDGDGVRLRPGDELPEAIQPLLGGRAAKVQVRDVRYGGHKAGFYPKGPDRKT